MVALDPVVVIIAFPFN